MNLTTKILAIALFLVVSMAILQVIVHHLTDPIRLGGHSISQNLVKIKMANTQLAIPENVIRRESQRQAGSHVAIDLYFQWPSLKGYTEKDANLFENTQNLGKLVFVTLTKEKTTNTPEQRLEGLYKRFFIKDPWRGPQGLIGHSLDPSSGYNHEDIFYARNNNNLFITRCLQEQEARQSGVLPTCLYDFNLTQNIKVTIRFHRNLLKDWQKIDRKIKTYLNGLILA